MVRNDDAPPRPAQTQAGRRDGSDRRDSGQTYVQQRVRRAQHSRRIAVHIVTAAPVPCQAANPSGKRLTLLDDVASLAANAFVDARRLALALPDERHDDAWLALSVANAVAEIANLAQCAVEITARLAAGGEFGK